MTTNDIDECNEQMDIPIQKAYNKPNKSSLPSAHRELRPLNPAAALWQQHMFDTRAPSDLFVFSEEKKALSKRLDPRDPS